MTCNRLVRALGAGALFFAMAHAAYAGDAVPSMHLSFGFGGGAGAAGALSIDSGFSIAGPAEYGPQRISLAQVTFSRQSVGSVLLGTRVSRSNNAQAGDSGWSWWAIAGAALVVAAVLGSSDSDENDPEGPGSAGICGDNDVVLGNNCVAGGGG